MNRDSHGKSVPPIAQLRIGRQAPVGTAVFTPILPVCTTNSSKHQR
jgi:hypothetical protein